MPSICIPTSLKRFTDHEEAVAVRGTVMREVLGNLVSQYPGISPYIFDQTGEICSYVCIYLNDSDIQQLEKESTPVADTDIVTIIPAIAGG